MDDIEKLLRYITHRYLARQDALEIERDATAAEDADDIAEDQRRAIRGEEQRADNLAGAFREGLKRAADAWRAGGNAISLDDRRPDEDRQADALIHFLVRPGIASSTSRQTEPNHYIYTVAVDWPVLERVAREAKVDLDDVIGPAG